MAEVLERSSKQAADAGGKVTTEAFAGGTLHIIVSAPPKEKNEDDAKAHTPPPPLVWGNSGTSYFIGSNVNLVKDMISHVDGRSTGALANIDSFAKTQAKTGDKQGADPLVPRSLEAGQADHQGQRQGERGPGTAG